MKKILWLTLLGVLAAPCFSTALEAEEVQKKDAQTVIAPSTQASEPSSNKTSAVLETDLGKIVISFYPEEAPKTVENFVKLVDQGFYNGTYFHRVIPGFMIQGGDPNTKDDNRGNDGMGGPGYMIDAEFNAHQHVAGIVSMARRSDPNSGGSQFFICVAPAPQLDGKYTAFGHVTQGMDIADKIVRAPRDRRDNPLEKISIKKAYLIHGESGPKPEPQGEPVPPETEAIPEAPKKPQGLEVH